MAGDDSVLSSREAAKAEIAKLHTDESNLIKEILDSNLPVREKLCKLAIIIERRYELGDFAYAITEISSYISSLFAELNPALSRHVSDYLPDKYKNPLHIAAGNLTEHIPTIRGYLIEELSMLTPVEQRAIIEQMVTLDNTTLEASFEIGKKIRERAAQIARDRGIDLLDQDLEDKIITRKPDKSYKTQFSVLLHECSIVAARKATILENLSKKAVEYPPTPENNKILIDAWIPVYEFDDNINFWLSTYEDHKFAFAMPSWIEVQDYNRDHGKHAAATSLKSGKVALPEDTICEDKTRPLTREQVGDNRNVIEKYKNKLINLNHVLDYLFVTNEFWHRPEVMPYIAERRVKMHEKLSKLA